MSLKAACESPCVSALARSQFASQKACLPVWPAPQDVAEQAASLFNPFSTSSGFPACQAFCSLALRMQLTRTPLLASLKFSAARADAGHEATAALHSNAVAAHSGMPSLSRTVRAHQGGGHKRQENVPGKASCCAVSAGRGLLVFHLSTSSIRKSKERGAHA